VKKSQLVREIEEHADAAGYGDELRDFAKSEPRKLTPEQRDLIARTMKAERDAD
jgi:hypothetical protein